MRNSKRMIRAFSDGKLNHKWFMDQTMFRMKIARFYEGLNDIR